MRRTCLIFLLAPFFLIAQSEPEEVLTKALNYHDPTGQWAELKVTFTIQETRPKNSGRSTTIALNNATGYMKINRNNEEVYEVDNEEVSILKGEKDQDRALLLRNYYLYLWGLPMKLLDENTPLVTLSGKEQVNEQPCDVLRVAYAADVWYFYINELSGRMLQYKFYKDEATGKGELIRLEDEVEIQRMKIPQKRSWYTLPEMEYLGTDILERVE